MIALELKDSYAAGCTSWTGCGWVTSGEPGDCGPCCPPPQPALPCAGGARRSGIAEGLVRLSIGLEDCADIEADLF
jgi:hypothetical protein